MSEPILEQIAQWIATALDGVSDDTGTVSLNVVRSTMIDWELPQFRHGDVLLELESIAGDDEHGSMESRVEIATWAIYGIVVTLPDDTAADTVLARTSETIRQALLAGNTAGNRSCDNLAIQIDCPSTQYARAPGMALAVVTCRVQYETRILDPYQR